MWIVYVIFHSLTDQIYVGKTKDLRRRLLEHNQNLQASTRHRSGKWRLVYAEAYASKLDADTRESKLKQHGSSKRELKKRIAHSLLEIKSGAGRSESISGDCLPKT